MNCHLCPVQCGVDRSKSAGRCGAKSLTIAKAYLHPYEEPPISFQKGSGTIFFCGCNLRCMFCQNFELSRVQRGKDITVMELVSIMKELEERGAENISFVTPDHVSHLIKGALEEYRPQIPVVYNSSGYCTVSALEEIDPYIDIYLPDLKFVSPLLAKRYTGREDYFKAASEAIKFMAKKPVVFREDGKMLSGILVRHLILPGCTSDSMKALDFLKETLPEDAPLSLMRQYTPMGEIADFPELNRKITEREYRRVLDYAEMLGFSTLYTQEKESADEKFIPQWEF
ncbi:MAG: radical SAM protein [Clostridiales bacterium]|nr:radical SAM protein [Clostridiales bacterium]